MKKYLPLSDVYGDVIGSKVPKPPRQTVNENVTVDFDFGGGGGRVSYSLPDEYAEKLHKRVKIEAQQDITKYVKEIFHNGDWGNQPKSEKEFTELVVESDVSHAVELLKYLAEEKDRLLEFNQVGITNIVDFVDLIVDNLPDKFNENGNALSNLIKATHLTIRPGASTSVGLGEATFAIFGTAKKGNSGDLQWSGYEVEIKTNGASDSGAVLGGDGTINKVSERLAKRSSYTDLQYDKIKKTLNHVDIVIDTFNEGDIEQANKLFDKVRKDLKIIQGKRSSRLYDSIINSELEAIMGTPISKTSLQPSRRDTGVRLIGLLKTDLESKLTSAAKKSTNLPSQIAALFSETGDDIDTYITVFSELKTYGHVFKNGKDQLRNFFTGRDFTQFNPRENYQNFQRLVGAIAIIGYQEVVEFDYLTAGNDNNFTMVAIDCKDPNLEKIYSQLERVPQIKFDIDIDVFEGGKFRSQTVFAKSPRIILAD